MSEAENDNGEMLKPDEVAARLKISRRSAYELVHRLGAVRIGRNVRLPAKALDRFIRRGGDVGPYDRVSSVDGE